jgi:hypothetical protein
LRLGRVLVDEVDVLCQSAVFHQLPELAAIGFAIASDKFRMRLADDEMQGRRVVLADHRHGLDHELEHFCVDRPGQKW